MKTNLLFLACVAFGSLLRAGELFVKVNDNTAHYAVSSGQTQYNGTNIFRFFDLPAGNAHLAVNRQHNGYTLYSGNIYIGQNQRVIAEISSSGHLSIVRIIQIKNVSWYETREQGSVSGTNPANPGHETNDIGPFLQQLDKETFDSSRLSFAKNYVDKGWFTAAQIAEIAKRFTFDTSRLEFAKTAYAHCSDPQNYFLLKEIFTFSSSYSQLEEYINKK